MGKKEDLPKDIRETVKNIEKKTFRNKTITINLALNYGSKEEIVNACRALISENKKEIM